MKFYIGNTDYNWFQYLKGIDPNDANFWQPGGTTNFKAIEQGLPFLFKLKSPYNAIAGVGFFVKHTKLPVSVAWEVFGVHNGCDDGDRLRQMVTQYRKDNIGNPSIGCIVLTNPVFFDQQDWIELPSDWKKNIVQGKTYDTKDRIGQEVWAKVEQKLKGYEERFEVGKPDETLVREPREGYAEVVTKARVGQGAFRIMVTDAYHRQCAITQEKTLPVLEASHIKPYSQSGLHKTDNGLLLRSDIHKLFDLGYMTITEDYKVEVSNSIHEEYQNGKEYYQFHGKELVNLPDNSWEKPESQFLQWHNEQIFKG